VRSRTHATLRSCALLRPLTRTCAAHRQLRALLAGNEWAANAELPNLPARVPLHAAVAVDAEPAVALLLR
jgi:hypothetical protein